MHSVLARIEAIFKVYNFFQMKKGFVIKQSLLVLFKKRIITGVIFGRNFSNEKTKNFKKILRKKQHIFIITPRRACVKLFPIGEIWQASLPLY